LRVESIGNILVRGFHGHGEEIEAPITIVRTAYEKDPSDVLGKILVIPRCGNNYVQFMKNSAGVILQNNVGDTASEKYAIYVAEELDIPLLVRADNAMTLLTEQEKVVLSPQKGLVFKREEKH